MASREYPTQEQLCKRLRYDAESGLLYWLPQAAANYNLRGWNTKYAGREAATMSAALSTSNGFARPLTLTINGRKQLFMSHRCIWIMVHGSIPADMVIDHANGDNCDNRLSNLRLATATQNMRNRRPAKYSQSKITGVRKKGRRWYASVSVDGEQRWLGSFPTVHEAASARRAAEIRYYGEFAPCLSRVGP